MANNEYLEAQMDRAKREKNKKQKSGEFFQQKCWASGCPIKPSMVVGGQQSCAYHFNAHYPSAITCAIKNNMKFIEFVSRMKRWNSLEWLKNDEKLNNHPRLPKGLKEPATLYIARFQEWLNDKINQEATEQIEGS